MHVNSVSTANFKSGDVILFNFAEKKMGNYNALKDLAKKELVDIYVIAKDHRQENVPKGTDLYMICAHNFQTNPYVVGTNSFFISSKALTEELLTKVTETSRLAIKNLREKINTKK